MSAQRLLIIDEDQSTIKYLGFNFKKEDFEVSFATNPKEGMIAAFKNRPHIIIVDPNISGMDIKDFIERLKKDRRIARTQLIAFSSLSNPQEIQTVIDLGFDYYIAKEGDAFPDLQKAVHESVDTLLAKSSSPAKSTNEPEQKPAGKEGKTVIFLSAKGGTGTSSICANLAHMCNEKEEYKIAVVDMVLPIGSIGRIVGYDGPLNIVEASQMTNAETSPEYLLESLPKPDLWGFQLLAGSPTPQQANELDISRIPVLIDTLKSVFDYVFVDLGKSLSRISLPIIQSADQIVLILGLDEATATLTYSVWDFLKANGIKPEQVYPLINRAVGLEGFSKSEVEETLGVTINNTIPYMERNFTLANNQHQPILHKYPDDAVTISMRQAVREITERIEKRASAMNFL